MSLQRKPTQQASTLEKQQETEPQEPLYTEQDPTDQVDQREVNLVDRTQEPMLINEQDPTQ